MSLSIIIVNYGKTSYSYLENCLKSIYESDIPDNFSIETIVIDNASDPNFISALKKTFHTTKFKTFDENLGYSKAANAGILIACGAYLLILNNDIAFRKNTISEIKKFIDLNKDFSVAGLQLLYSDGTLQYSKGKYPAILKIFFGLFKSPFRKKWDTANYDKLSESEWVSGAAILIKNNGETRLKFDETYFMYYEDVDLCFNVKKRGGNVLYIPSIQVYHLNPFHVKQNIDKNLYYEIRKSQLFFFYKNYGIVNYMILKFLTIFYITTIVFFSAIFFRKKYASVFKVYKHILKKLLTHKYTFTRNTN